jgi:uncharacterized membrane protein
MKSERGFRRLVAFSDAVVAIAITLLVLPLVNRAGAFSGLNLGSFFDQNKYGIFTFALSFAVIGNLWWAQHQEFERVNRYNAVLVGGMFLWLFSIVFLPFPTELLGSAQHTTSVSRALYIGTLLVAEAAALIQQWAIVTWPELQEESGRGGATIVAPLAQTVLMGVAFALAVALPAVGLWALVVLAFTKPLRQLLARVLRR